MKSYPLQVSTLSVAISYEQQHDLVTVQQTEELAKREF